MKNTEIRNEIKDGNLFNFIANRGHELSKQELKDLVKEIDYAIRTFQGNENYDKFCKEFAESEYLEDIGEEE